MPIFTPIAAELGIDLARFLVIMAVNLNIRLHLAVGLRRLPAERQAGRGQDLRHPPCASPFMGLQLAAPLIVMLFSPTVTWLAGTS